MVCRLPASRPRIPVRGPPREPLAGSGGPGTSIGAGILTAGEVAERLMAALLKSAESKDFVGSNPTLSATATRRHGLAVSDVCSAMTTTRPYRKAFDVAEALRHLKDAAGPRSTRS